MLEVNNLHARYGLSRVLHGVSLALHPGEMVCLIGRNGVGKSTLLKAIMGLAERDQGRITLRGQDITGWPLHRLARNGVSFIPEDRGLFPSLSVEENLLTGTFAARGRKSLDLQAVYELFPQLRDRRRQPANSLSGGEQQMLAVGRALVSNPQLLLVDEFSEGLQPSMVSRIAAVIREINRRGVTMLLVEQNVRLALRLCQRGYVLEKGQVVHHGSAQDLLASERVLKKYLVI